MEDAHRGSTAFKVAYPGPEERETFMPYVARYRGPIPDFYDRFPFLAYMVRKNQGLERCKAQIEHIPMEEFNGKATPDWELAEADLLLADLENHTISLGAGKGRSEAVDLGKSNPPAPVVSRWSFRRREKG
jgi:hypothetical protein